MPGNKTFLTDLEAEEEGSNFLENTMGKKFSTSSFKLSLKFMLVKEDERENSSLSWYSTTFSTGSKGRKSTAK